MAQLRVKKSNKTAVVSNGTTTQRRPGIEGLAYDQYVDEFGNTWTREAFGAQGITPAGDLATLRVDPFGNLASATPNALVPGSTPQNSTSVAYEASRFVKSSSGVLLGISGYNSKTSTQFILIVDYGDQRIPATGTVPAIVIAVSASSNFSYDPGQYGRSFSAGIWIVNSSTGPTVTVGSADCWFDVQYV